MSDKNIFFDLAKLKYLGKGVIIGKTVRIRKPELVEIGDGSIIDDFTYISTSLKTGKCCHIAAGVNISGGGGCVEFGNYVAVSAGCSIHAASSEYIRASLDYPSVPEENRFGGILGDVKFDNFVILGAHSIVLPGVHLPEGFASGAKTIIRNRKYDSWMLYAGDEARVVCKRNNKKILDLIAKGKL